MKATDLLKQQHRTVEALFAKIEAGDSSALEQLCRVILNMNEFVYPD